MGYQEIHSKRGARATRAAERKRQGGGVTSSSNENREGSISWKNEGTSEGDLKEENSDRG